MEQEFCIALHNCHWTRRGRWHGQCCRYSSQTDHPATTLFKNTHSSKGGDKVFVPMMTSRCALITMMLRCAQVLSLTEKRDRFPRRSPYTMNPIKMLAVCALLLILLQHLKLLTIFLLILNGCLAHLACNSPKHLQILQHARTYILTTKSQMRTGVRTSTKKYLRAMELKKRFVAREWFSEKIWKNWQK